VLTAARPFPPSSRSGQRRLDGRLRGSSRRGHRHRCPLPPLAVLLPQLPLATLHPPLSLQRQGSCVVPAAVAAGPLLAVVVTRVALSVLVVLAVVTVVAVTELALRLLELTPQCATRMVVVAAVALSRARQRVTTHLDRRRMSVAPVAASVLGLRRRRHTLHHPPQATSVERLKTRRRLVVSLRLSTSSRGRMVGHPLAAMTSQCRRGCLCLDPRMIDLPRVMLQAVVQTLSATLNWSMPTRAIAPSVVVRALVLMPTCLWVVLMLLATVPGEVAAATAVGRLMQRLSEPWMTVHRRRRPCVVVKPLARGRHRRDPDQRIERATPATLA
jgi:hypothetical protein